MRSVFFTNANTGFAVGNGGTLLKTNDGGMSWINKYIDAYEILKSVYFYDTNTGYCLGWNGILKTTDAGEHWISAPVAYSAELHSIGFLNADTGFAVGSNSLVCKTTDAGANWVLDTTLLHAFSNSICFPDHRTGYIVGRIGIMAYKKDGTGFSEIKQEQVFSIFPNPAGKTITIRMLKTAHAKNTFISIYNEGGMLLIHKPVTRQKTEIDIGSLAQGVYVVEVRENNNNMVSKFVKE